MTEKKIPRPEHPQPMMQRENWQNLNGEWLFEFDFGVSGAERGLFKPDKAEEYTKKIIVPFCPESELSGIAYKDFIQYRYKPSEDYYKFLQRIGYAEDSNYISKLKKVVKKNDTRRSK